MRSAADFHQRVRRRLLVPEHIFELLRRLQHESAAETAPAPRPAFRRRQSRPQSAAAPGASLPPSSIRPKPIPLSATRMPLTVLLSTLSPSFRRCVRTKAKAAIRLLQSNCHCAPSSWLRCAPLPRNRGMPFLYRHTGWGFPASHAAHSLPRHCRYCTVRFRSNGNSRHARQKSPTPLRGARFTPQQAADTPPTP